MNGGLWSSCGNGRDLVKDALGTMKIQSYSSFGIFTPGSAEKILHPVDQGVWKDKVLCLSWHCSAHGSDSSSCSLGCGARWKSSAEGSAQALLSLLAVLC